MPQEIARLHGSQYDAQFNIAVKTELKERFKKLKSERRVDTAEEIRKALVELAERLERTLGVTQVEAS